MASYSKSSSSDQAANAVNINVFDTKGYILENGFTILVKIFGLGMLAMMLFVIVVVAFRAFPAIQNFGPQFIFNTNWNVGTDEFGAAPYIYGTIVSSAIAILLATPVGVAIALTTSENFVPKSVRMPIAYTVELIAAIPSVIIGLWGIFTFVPVIKPFQEFLHSTLGWIPLFGTESSGFNIMTAGVLLAIMIIPTVGSISRDVLIAVPAEFRSASMGLGATRWETITRVILPAASPGILGAVMLALGRALGETMAVTMVIGNTAQISASLLDSGYSIPAVIANEFAEAAGDLHPGALLYLGLILFALTLIVNIGAVLLVQLFTKD
ncbi:phosphate ABC transporter, permease protein PstC [Synechococcus sp. PCC 7502]|uniref:phosphate ABC transporter permease subunit PstC n=1 Tax=Synechococcus sp. PCC 7502 TaxID=1173263 RepID=UPI00029FA341|nr:phosphate ABC transporter permease subunit PstC [Synechococcus sp. PCC 7502]AFY72197.1 phosphate ABC transporter, permease protein PstC [Synechococcus sp. PCC 7502]